MPSHPLAEVFGFPADNMSQAAERHRSKKLCPFGNKVPNCTKNSVSDPLGVCTVFDGSSLAITCPVRFREGWIIADDAAEFFGFPAGEWTTLTEIKLKNAVGAAAGNIDVVVVRYNSFGQVTDFGALEIQAVYISGNIGIPFKVYMSDPPKFLATNWKQTNPPRPDYLSSSRKRLAPQLIFKGGIIHAWKKKSAVALHSSFFDTLPQLDEVSPAEAELAWLIYDLQYDSVENHYHLTKQRTVYTMFAEALDRITKTGAGSLDEFVNHLQDKLDVKLTNCVVAPDTANLIADAE